MCERCFIYFLLYNGPFMDVKWTWPIREWKKIIFLVNYGVCWVTFSNQSTIWFLPTAVVRALTHACRLNEILSPVRTNLLNWARTSSIPRHLSATSISDLSPNPPSTPHVSHYFIAWSNSWDFNSYMNNNYESKQRNYFSRWWQSSLSRDRSCWISYNLNILPIPTRIPTLTGDPSQHGIEESYQQSNHVLKAFNQEL